MNKKKQDFLPRRLRAVSWRLLKHAALVQTPELCTFTIRACLISVIPHETHKDTCWMNAGRIVSWLKQCIHENRQVIGHIDNVWGGPAQVVSAHPRLREENKSSEFLSAQRESQKVTRSLVELKDPTDHLLCSVYEKRIHDYIQSILVSVSVGWHMQPQHLVFVVLCILFVTSGCLCHY